MSIDSTRAEPVATQQRLTVPWLTVLPFAVVLAYADVIAFNIVNP